MPRLRVDRIRELLSSLVKKYPELRGHKRLQLIYTAIENLRKRGEKLTLENIVSEARRIAEDTRGEIDWGIKPSEYTEDIAVPLLYELAQMGAVELSPELLSEVSRRIKKRSEGREEVIVMGVSLVSKPL